ncbi:SusC/RagA family TonB-linked outer membrane protein [Pararhodonellum marinum]|uniref:SusC/RagA family TonB-linked outer membrane protein n=1 Tax=Pararhodonellum marinum TaxID=2755358 RepID=UPI00188DE73A|nr:TonB-dependent receptor [Pararhodonellum marinum]
MKQIVLVFLFCLLIQPLLAQEETVTGKVTASNDGESLPGVNVLVKGTNRGTITDLDGNFRIEAPRDGVLVFSFIGYDQLETPINGRSTVNISLQESTGSLDEVVVVGYGSKVRRDITGAISSVKADELAKIPTPSFDQALQGLAAGVNVTSSNGVPGAPTRVMIRGTNSISSGTEPLWVIDGMILSNQGGGEIGGFARSNHGATQLNPLATLNPNDIESIEILKDASATAIYGSRGANGVIIVTTKTGRGTGGLDISITSGVTNVARGPQEIGFVNGPTWLGLVDTARENSGLFPFDPNAILNDARDPTAVLSREQLADVNYFNEALQQGSFQDIGISTSKAGDGFSYYLSGNYRNDKGIQTGSGLERYSTRANVDFSPIKNLEIGTRITLSYTKQQRPPNGGPPGGNTNMATGGYNMAISGALPIIPIFHPTITSNGNPILFDPLSGRNLRATLDRDNYLNDVNSYRAIGGLFLDYKIPFVDGLSVRTEFSADMLQTSNIEWGNTVIRERSAYAFDFSNTFTRLNYNVYATYNKQFADIHAFNFVVGTENTTQQQRTRNIEAQDLFGVQPEVGAPGDIMRVSAGLGGEINFRGIFSRLDYKLKDRYLVGFSARRDGSSVFVPENRWGNFIAVSGGWILSEENFMRGANNIDLLKLRGSFGQTGNSAINPFATMTTYAGWGRYGDTGAGDLLMNIGNQALTWETTDAFDLGLDYELFNNRISGSIGYYRQDASDLLLQVEVPQSSGIFANQPRLWANVGDLLNQGFEFEISTVNIDKNNFKWTTSFNYTTNQNQVTKLTGGQGEQIYNVQQGPHVTRVGERLGFFRLAQYAGIHPEGGYEMIYEMDREHFAQTGERIKTGNVIPATRDNLTNHLLDFEDKSGLPTFFGGFINNFSYKGLELNIQFTFQGGNYIYDVGERGNSYIGTGGSVLRSSLVDNTWTESNPDADWPKLVWNHRYDVINEDGTVTPNVRFDNNRAAEVHDKFLQRGDFIRLRTLQLAYNLPPQLLQKLGLRQARVFTSATNLLTFTKYQGFDPEVLQLGDAQFRNLGQGFVGAQLPQLRSINFGLNLSF